MDNNQNNGTPTTQEPNNQTPQEPTTPNTPNAEKTQEELMAEIAALKLENQKVKNDRDKALKGKGEAEKNLRARMTAQEQEEEAKRLEQERVAGEIAELRAYKQNAEAKARYALQGMSEELATAAAKAEVEDDHDTLAKVYQKHMDAVVNSKMAEWMRTRPNPDGGQGCGEGADPFLEGLKRG